MFTIVKLIETLEIICPQPSFYLCTVLVTLPLFPDKMLTSLFVLMDPELSLTGRKPGFRTDSPASLSNHVILTKSLNLCSVATCASRLPCWTVQL